nr:PREDICTED: uncharacterized protein LOC103974869 [Musa acuminata subsp. malaccensis]
MTMNARLHVNDREASARNVNPGPAFLLIQLISTYEGGKTSQELIGRLSLMSSTNTPMSIGLLHAVMSLVSTCSSRMARAARKLSRRRCNVIPSARGKKMAVEEDANGELEDGGDGVWRRTILMGEKCQPLDFSGVIYYDADGRRLSEVPTQRSPLRSPLPSLPLKAPMTAN